jgi:hypothetical protein
MRDATHLSFVRGASERRRLDLLAVSPGLFFALVAAACLFLSAFLAQAALSAFSPPPPLDAGDRPTGDVDPSPVRLKAL